MSTQRYSVTPHSIETLLSWVKSSEIAIPEIQRPFVWDSTKVRNLLDSLYLGYPVGYLITWQSPAVKLKDGSSSRGKKILIDGQQRVTALMASILGYEVLTKEYIQTKIKIAFNPLEEKFEVSNPAIQKDTKWISDISYLFDLKTNLLMITKQYVQDNPDVDENLIFGNLDKIKKLTGNYVGVIELSHNLDIETVTEIFIRVNSAGSPLSQADFAMSKISVNETYNGNTLRKAIDYFCHMAVSPEFYSTITKHDTDFAKTEYFSKMTWLKNENDDIYDPTYTDLLRVAFVSEFNRGRLQDLVALISGRNFETKDYEESIIKDSFERLSNSIYRFINENNFKSFLLIIRSAGFVDSSLIGSQNALNFAYILYLSMKKAGVKNSVIEQQVRRWFVFSTLTGRYSGSTESVMDFDIKQINSIGIEVYSYSLYQGQLSDAFWNTSLPQEMVTSVASSPHFKIYRAAQVKKGDFGFLSRDITVKDLVEVKSDVHHIFPREFLKSKGLGRNEYNQIANYAIAQSEINIAISSKEPLNYMGYMIDEQCKGAVKKYGNIDDLAELHHNVAMNCIPQDICKFSIGQYQEFLTQRRLLMAQKIKVYFESL